MLAAVHATFPEPVPYIGGYGVVASFPRQGFFMSSWGVEDYHRARVPIFADIVARTQPPLLLAGFTFALSRRDSGRDRHAGARTVS